MSVFISAMKASRNLSLCESDMSAHARFAHGFAMKMPGSLFFRISMDRVGQTSGGEIGKPVLAETTMGWE